MSNTYIINEQMELSDFMKALEALEGVAYTMLQKQEDSYNSLHNKVFKALHSALLDTERLLDNDK